MSGTNGCIGGTKKSVKEFYGSGNSPMGLLLEYFHYLEDSNKEYNYKHFNELFLKILQMQNRIIKL